MKRRITTTEEETPEQEFHEAMPATREVYREPVFVDDEADRGGVNGWAILGLVLLAALVLTLLLGRAGVGDGTTPTNTAPVTPSTQTQ